MAFVAVAHAQGLENPTFATVRREFETFHPQAVLVEGLSLPLMKSKELERAADACARATYADCSESFYTINLARQEKIAYVLAEPRARDITAAMLRAGFSRQDVLARFLLGDFPRHPSEAELPSWFEENAARLKRRYGLDIAFPLADLRSWYRKNVSRSMDLLQYDGHFYPDREATSRFEEETSGACAMKA